ncbi:P-loop containing nucleoside triphosphate hydrolase protein [Lipomyces chichibuensis]|uniref:P-loop containing nucleoside triphosphate hydrolase protein n=1 Tax=Lipomyces chichibuensis TaxID=1546026 RepID=UPI0033433284
MDPLRHDTSSQSVKDTSFEVEDVYEDDELTLQQSNGFAEADVFSLQEQQPTSRDDTKVAVDQKAPHRSSSPTHRLRLSLNERQLRAVTFPLQSQLQILAGPGTGKTKTLISRVIFLLSQGVHPSNIIVTTFTVKAANEMRERIAAMVGPSVASRLVLGTFHSIARRYLIKYGYLIGLPTGFQIADETDALHFIQSVMKEVDPESDKNDCRHARNAISNMKSRAIQPSSLSALEYTTQEMMQVYSLYQGKLAEANFLDFDDLLLKCMELLRTNPLVVSNIQAVLVDEFQDTNVVQYQLMKLFAARRSNITIVGDPDQSIYAFRAAESTNLMRMRQDFQDTSVVSLEENYRSSGHILNAALAVIQQDTERIQKTVLPNHDEGHMPVFFPARNPYIEARHIVKEIQRLIDLSCGMLKPHDFAILVRSARLTRPIESELTKAGIDYRIVGGFRFWEREEIKLLVNYLVVVKSRRSPALLDIINSPRRGIGSVMQAALLNHANAYQVPIWDAIQRAIDGQVRVNAKVRSSLKQFVDIITEAERLVQDSSRETPLADALDYLITALDYKEALRKDRGDTWAARWENVTDLKEHIRYFCATAPDPELPDIDGVEGTKAADDVLSRFLATVNLAPSEAESSAFDPTMVLTISTIHGSKGLEWPVVFIPGVYEGSIPHALSLAKEVDLAEERRLLYVAMTRAKGENI